MQLKGGARALPGYAPGGLFHKKTCGHISCVGYPSHSADGTAIHPPGQPVQSIAPSQPQASNQATDPNVSAYSMYFN